LYVDAFRGRFLQETQNPNACFILTHYHGDHYQNLPKDGRYQGPAVIHCTHVTAKLLREVHQIPTKFIQPHDYESTFQFEIIRNHQHHQQQQQGSSAKITFFDANHCPGACIVLVQLPNGNAHLHTGDMRYDSKKFKSYPLLRDVVTNRKLDLVYLDTTYGHPKHDFVPQEEAIESIASQSKELLSSSSESSSSSPGSNVLVLLSCYSIGKEKVLWETSTRCNQLLYVTERKLRMLRCIQSSSLPSQTTTTASLLCCIINLVCIHFADESIQTIERKYVCNKSATSSSIYRECWRWYDEAACISSYIICRGYPN